MSIIKGGNSAESRRQPHRQEAVPADSLVELATFFARRWSENTAMEVRITEQASKVSTRLAENLIVIASLEKRTGDYFQRYRQLRTALWYESVRARHCTKILSNDHAFGFILNAMETYRIERVGLKVWRGMDKEIIMYRAHMLADRPQLHEVYGRARIVEAFYQHLLFGAIKGELQESHIGRVKEATDFAREKISSAISEGKGTDWLEGHTRKIIEMLDIDSLLTIPVSLPFARAGMALDEAEMKRVLKLVLQNDKRTGRADNASDVSDVMRGSGDIHGEYAMLTDESQIVENRGREAEPIGIKTPEKYSNANEAAIYDAALISSLKIKFKEWKSGWKEAHTESAGEEFDAESYIEGHEPFIKDVKKSIKDRIMILLDHSGSITRDAKDYKKATLALCEVLSFLRVGFSVYAFSYNDGETTCWSIKPEQTRWNAACAKKLASIEASGGTPLAVVYEKMLPILQAKVPDIFLTLTDGAPNDPDGVRRIVTVLRKRGIRMVALALGSKVKESTNIANNLKDLGYEKTVAVSRLADIPAKVVGILERQ